MADVDPAASGRAAWAGRIPRGSAATLGGIVVSGLSGFGSLAVATRVVEPGARGALAAVWTLVFLVGPAVFFPLEQALAGRLLAGASFSGGRVLRTAAAQVAVLSVLAVALAPFYLDDLLDGRRALLAAVVGSLAGYAAQHVLRAVLVARGSFGRYAVVLGLDGLLRLVGCAVAALAGARSPEPYAWVIGLAPLVATAACAYGTRWPGSGDARLGGDFARLLVASVCANVVIGAGPAVLKVLDGDAALVSSYLVMVSLTRIPLLLGQALLGPLLGGLGTSLAAGRVDEYRRSLDGALGAVLAVGAATTAAFALVAPYAVPVLFGRDNDRLGWGPAAVLAACAVLYLAGQLLTQALVAQGSPGEAATGWAVALVAGGLTLAFWPGTLSRVLAATAAGCALGALALVPAARRGPRTAPAGSGRLGG